MDPPDSSARESEEIRVSDSFTRAYRIWLNHIQQDLTENIQKIDGHYSHCGEFTDIWKVKWDNNKMHIKVCWEHFRFMDSFPHCLC